MTGKAGPITARHSNWRTGGHDPSKKRINFGQGGFVAKRNEQLSGLVISAYQWLSVMMERAKPDFWVQRHGGYGAYSVLRTWRDAVKRSWMSRAELL